VGAADEQHPGQGNGDRKSRAYLCIRQLAAGSNPRRCCFERAIASCAIITMHFNVTDRPGFRSI
jgi:hypothetical protein